MSSSKGNVSRSRPQKHQNRTVFKNDLHDTSVKTKFIKSIQPSGICVRCKEIIEWKIKYKKYKPLTAPKKCVKCDQKTVKYAYHIMCTLCAKNERACAKCGKVAEVVENQTTTPAEDEELNHAIKALSERKRRTLLRYLKKQKEKSKKKTEEPSGDGVIEEDTETDAALEDKINKLKLQALNDELGDSDDLGSEFDSELDSNIDDSEDENE